MHTIANAETAVEMKFNANVDIELKDSVYQVAVDSCRLHVWTFNGKIYGSIQIDFKVFDEAERNIAILKLSDNEFEIKHALAKQSYSSSSECISIKDIVTDSDLSRSRLYDVIDDDLMIDIEVFGT